MADRMGFRFNENMYGTYEREDKAGEQKRFMFHIEAVSANRRQTL